MSVRQKMSILSNEMIRRLSNMNIEKAEDDEKQNIVEHFITQLKTSGYDRKQAREVVVSGIRGWKRKIERRRELGQDFYRGAASTLKQRIRKKLIDPVNWYKNKIDDKKTQEPEEQEDKAPKTGKRKRKTMEEGEREAEIENNKRIREEDPKTVLFCPYTKGSELAKQIREAETDMEKTTGYKIKVVEESGEKIMDILHTSNPWKGEDCGREKCLLCKTKQMTGKGKKSDCMKRSLVYETWCETCLRTEITRIENEDIDEDEKEQRKRKVKVHKYVGETARSAYERGLEHQIALERMEEDSHMMKHIANIHQDKEISEVEFGMRVVSFTRSALERQVLESVKIQEERRENIILNSKSEYSRCTIPRLTAKMGDVDYDKLRDAEKKEEMTMELTLRQDIARRRKENCKKRGKEIHDGHDQVVNNKQKRRKVDTDLYKTVIQPIAVNREEKSEKDDKDEKDKTDRKKARKEHSTVRFLGGEWKDMELAEEVDWKARRQEIIDRLEKEERERVEKIERAKK